MRTTNLNSKGFLLTEVVMAAGILSISILACLKLSQYLVTNQSADQHRVVASVLAQNIIEDLNTRLGTDNDLGNNTHIFYYDSNQLPSAAVSTYKASYKVRKSQGYFTISLTVSWQDFGPSHTVYLQESRSQN